MQKENKNSINQSRRKLLSLAGAAGTGMLLSPLLSKAAPTTIIESGSNVDTASYIIFQDSGTIYAKNGTTGKIEFSGTDASTVIQSAVNILTKGGSIFIKTNTSATEYVIPGRFTIFVDYILTSSILMNNDVSIFSDGATLDITKLNDVAFRFNPNGEQYFIKKNWLTVSGLQFIGNTANANTGAIDVLNWSRGMVIDNIKTWHISYPLTLRGSVYNCNIQNSQLDTGVEGIRLLKIGDGSGGHIPNAVKIHNNDIGNFAKSINMDSGLTVKITSNYFEATITGINITGGSVHITNNYFNPYANNKAIYTNVELSILGNIFDLGTNTIGIHFDKYYGRSSIANNQISLASGSKFYYSTQISSPVITGNIGYSTVDGGSYISAPLRMASILGNFVTGSSIAFNLTGGYKNIVSHNSFYGCATAIQDTNTSDTISDNSFNSCTTDLNVNGANNIIHDNLFEDAVIIIGSQKARNNIGYKTESSGAFIGTGSQKIIPHGLAKTPSIIILSNKDDGADPFQSAPADATNIYIIAATGKGYVWKAEV